MMGPSLKWKVLWFQNRFGSVLNWQTTRWSKCANDCGSTKSTISSTSLRLRAQSASGTLKVFTKPTIQPTCSKTLIARENHWTTTLSKTRIGMQNARNPKNPQVKSRAKKHRKSLRLSANLLSSCNKSTPRRCWEPFRFCATRLWPRRSLYKRRQRRRSRAWFKKWTKNCRKRTLKACFTVSGLKSRKSLLRATLYRRTHLLIKWGRRRCERSMTQLTTQDSAKLTKRRSTILTGPHSQ